MCNADSFTFDIHSDALEPSRLLACLVIAEELNSRRTHSRRPSTASAKTLPETCDKDNEKIVTLTEEVAGESTSLPSTGLDSQSAASKSPAASTSPAAAPAEKVGTCKSFAFSNFFL